MPADYQRRRTFAIISHPDAGKTTLTEKLLLAGGAIHLAGSVKARGDKRRARSDWMKIEQERGISVTSSVTEMARSSSLGTSLIITTLPKRRLPRAATQRKRMTADFISRHGCSLLHLSLSPSILA